MAYDVNGRFQVRPSPTILPSLFLLALVGICAGCVCAIPKLICRAPRLPCALLANLWRKLKYLYQSTDPLHIPTLNVDVADDLAVIAHLKLSNFNGRFITIDGCDAFTVPLDDLLVPVVFDTEELPLGRKLIIHTNLPNLFRCCCFE